MKKYDFILECIDQIYTLSVASNFTIENYKNISVFSFYKGLFNNYVKLSDYYDKYMADDTISEDEKRTRLLFAIDLTKAEALNLFFDSFEDIVKKQKLDYNVRESFSVISESKKGQKISSIFKQMLIDIRKIEESDFA